MSGKHESLLAGAFLLLAVASAGLAGKVGNGAEPRYSAQTTAQVKVGGSISGAVRGPSGSAIAGAKVTLRAEGAAQPAAQATLTDANGQFEFAAVPPGTYTVEATSAGFSTTLCHNVAVRDGAQVVADLQLGPPAAGIPAPTSEPAQPNRNQLESAGGKASLPGTRDVFNYDDRATFQPGSVKVAAEPGGYSAGRQVDSYSLMLDYIESEGVDAPLRRRPGTTSVAGPADMNPASPSTPPTAAELSTWNESQFLARGSDLLLHRDLMGSVDTFQSGVARFPDSPQLQAGLGIALSARGEYAKAIACLLRATDLTPSDPHPYYVLARAYIGAPGQNAEVIKRLRRLQAADPRNARAPYYLALVLAKGSPEDAARAEAESLLKDAVARDANFADAHLQLGILYASRSDYAAAIAEYQSALRLDPSLAAAHYRLAQAYNRTGDKAAAENELRAYERLRQP